MSGAVTQPTGALRRSALPRIFGTRPLTRAYCAAAYFVTAVSFVRVLQRLATAGISYEDTTIWSAAFRVVLDGDGAQVYDPVRQAEAMRDIIGSGAGGAPPWAFPPPHTFALSPFGLLSPFQLYVVLTVVSAFVWCAMVRSLVGWTRTRPESWSDDAVAITAACAIAFAPAMGTIRYGSFSILVVAALWAGIRRTLAEERAASVAAWWFAAALKPQMVVLTMLGAVRHRTRSVVGAGGAVLLASAALAAAVGSSLLRGWVSVNVSYGKSAPGAPIARMWTVRGVLTRALGDHAAVNIAWGAVALAGLIAVASMGLRSSTPHHLMVTLASALMLQCVAFPYQSSYDTVLVVPAIVLAFDAGLRVVPRVASCLGLGCAVAGLVVFSPAWEERLPGLEWRTPLPALLIWAATALVLWIAVAVHREQASELQPGELCS